MGSEDEATSVPPFLPDASGIKAVHKVLTVKNNRVGQGSRSYDDIDPGEYRRFFGDWEVPFKEHDTEIGTFYCPNNVVRTVEFTENRYAFVRSYNVLHHQDNVEVGDPHLIILNVIDKKFSVMLLLPTGNTGGIAGLEKMLTAEKLLTWRQKSVEGNLHIIIPKFTIRCGVDMIPAAKAMGLHEMFVFSGTNFERMFEDDGGPKKVDQFRQEVVIALDECGVKASAATFCEIGYKSCWLSRPDFNANRPFLVIIWNEIANVPVFIGRIMDPSCSGA